MGIENLRLPCQSFVVEAQVEALMAAESKIPAGTLSETVEQTEHGNTESDSDTPC